MSSYRAVSDRARRASARQDPDFHAAIRASLAENAPAPPPSETGNELPDVNLHPEGQHNADSSLKRPIADSDLELPNKATRLQYDTDAAETLHDGQGQSSPLSDLTELARTPEPPVLFADIVSSAPQPQDSDQAELAAVPEIAAPSPDADLDQPPPDADRAELPTTMPPPKAAGRRQSGRAINRPEKLGHWSHFATADGVAATVAATKPEHPSSALNAASKARDGAPSSSKRTLKRKSATQDQTTERTTKAGAVKRKRPVGKSTTKTVSTTLAEGLSSNAVGDGRSDEAEHPIPKRSTVASGSPAYRKLKITIGKPSTQPETPGLKTPAPAEQAARKPRKRKALVSMTQSKKLQAGAAAMVEDPMNGVAAGLPSPPLSQPTASPIDESPPPKYTTADGLLELSRFLAHREPMDIKPLPQGEPEVWAPGRQELCETLPYYQSYNSGCYANGGTIYSFMFDGGGVAREYMDENVIIARMGGSMGSESGDSKSGISQLGDHDINSKQPQAFLNNIKERNPIVIICGDKNTLSPTKMPHRYCVLDWFKPTHVWAEKTSSGKKPKITVKYRLERLDRKKTPWYATSPQSELVRAEHATLMEYTCDACQRTSAHMYLPGWMCLNAQCPQHWKLPNGEDAPYGEMEYHPAFVMHHVPWEREDPPYGLNPGVPQIGSQLGENLLYANTRGVVCPQCGRCNMRYLFRGWRCDTPGCDWRLTPNSSIVRPENMHHNPWDLTSDGPSLSRASAKPVVKTEVKYFHNFKVIKYKIDGVEGSIIIGKANKTVTSQPGGPDDMFMELQSVDFGLERRMLRKTATPQTTNSTVLTGAVVDASQVAQASNGQLAEDDVEDAQDDHEHEHEAKGEAGARMVAFGMNFGNPYKFIASGDSRSFEVAPEAVRMARAMLNWAQLAFVNDAACYQDFNEELIFAYMENQKIKYHDDGEDGLGPRIATMSLGGAATMLLRVKDKYFSSVSTSGLFTDEKSLPLTLLESSGYASGYTTKTKSAALQLKAKPSRDTYEGRMAAWTELQALKAQGHGTSSAQFRARSKELSSELGLKRKHAEPVLSFHLTHGDIVIMEGEEIQKYLEHQVEPHGNLRFALTCRTILPSHLTADQMPAYEVKPDEWKYDGAAVREARDGDTIVWSA